MPYNKSPELFLDDDQYLYIGYQGRAGLGYDTEDQNANIVKLNLPTGGSVHVPGFIIGYDIAGRDLGLFNGLTQPIMGAVDADRDSYVTVTFSADDTPVVSIKVSGTAIRSHTIPNVTSDTIGLIAATQTLTNKTLTSPTINTPTIGTSVTLSDSVTIAAGTTTGLKVATGTAQKLGFWNATPVVQPSAYTQTYSTANKTHANRTAAALTDSSGGTAGGTLAAITGGGGTSCEDATKNAVASLGDQVNKLIADQADTAQIVNSIIDDLQATGIVG